MSGARTTSEAVTYRAMRPDEVNAVAVLARDSFREFIAPEYTPAGVAEFEKYVTPEAIATRVAADHFVRVAVAGGRPVGMIEIRANNHVALLFVDRTYQRLGIASGLLADALAAARALAPDLARVTVNSSRYGVPAYEKLGFRQTGPERVVKGIAFIPMAMRLD